MPVYPGTVDLASDLERIAGAAAEHAHGDVLAAVLAAEPASGARIYLCAFERVDGGRSWLALDGAGRPLSSRRDVRDGVAIAALCEVAEESAFPGDLDELRSQLVALRVTESPPGIDEAEEAALALQRVLGAPPQLATPARLDQLGAAARRLELALDPTVGSPFTAAMQSAQAVVEELLADVEASYRIPLDQAAATVSA
jgi:hypothetical protein